MPTPVAARSKAFVYSSSPAGIVGSNPAGGMDVLSFVRSKFLRRPDPLSRDLLGVVCLNVMVKPR